MSNEKIEHIDKTKVQVVIPTLNEEEGIKDVIHEIKSKGYDNIKIIDGGSTDDTQTVVREQTKAELIEQQIPGGKGSAVRQSINEAELEYIVLIDGDNTYEVKDIDDVVRSLHKGNDHVVVNRFHQLKKDSMSVSHQIGNTLINKLFYVLYFQNFSDILSGFRGIKVSSFDNLDIQSTGFDIEVELSAKSCMNNHNVDVISSGYRHRKGESKLNGVIDGMIILSRLLSERLNHIINK
jgi:dolichol-phosphate mannosyltransferase